MGFRFHHWPPQPGLLLQAEPRRKTAGDEEQDGPQQDAG